MQFSLHDCKKPSEAGRGEKEWKNCLKFEVWVDERQAKKMTDSRACDHRTVIVSN
jgi:hypothetical protein